jgi:HAD superfamily hydrolase (TIGR01509 family)
VLIALSLVLAGPTFAKSLGMSTGSGAAFEWSWLILQWPLVFALVATAVGLVYYFGPDADQDWRWITPGAVGATALWLVVSLLFKAYIANFTNYNDAYGAVGGVIVLLLWFYVSGVAILAGAELNAEIEHASVYGKLPVQKNAAGKRLLGRRAERAFQHRQRTEPSPIRLPSLVQSRPASQKRERASLLATFMAILLIGRFLRRGRGRIVHGGLARADGPNVLPPLRDVSAVLFDVDGTLVESNGAHAEAWAQALSEHGFNGDATRIRPLIGMGGDKLLPAIAGIHEDSRKGRAIVRRKKELFAGRVTELRPSRGARSLVDHLCRLNKAVIVATSADDHEMAAVLERAGVADLIRRRTSKDDATRSKPDPDIVNAALRQSGSQADKTFMIGDTPYDIEAARRAGIAAIALRCGGHWSDRDLQGAIAIFDDPAALLDHWRRPTT